ncbi:MAG: hypothetical protein WAW61_22330 [Methylococcaceae bacterium]
MKAFQIEITADKGTQSVYTCSTVKASTRLRAISKAVRESKKCGHSNQREIKAIVSDSENYKNLVF